MDYGLELPGKKDIGVGIKQGANHYAMTDTFSVDNLRVTNARAEGTLFRL